MALRQADTIPSSELEVYPQAIILSALALGACTLAIPPLILQTKSHNLSSVTLILSIALTNLLNTINPILWNNDNMSTWYSGVGLCDVEAKLQVGLSIAIPASATCVCRELACILSQNNISVNGRDRLARRLQLTFDTTLCIIFPVYIMSVHVLVQPFRYYIYGISGCQYSLSKSWITVPLVLIWPMLISLLGTFYSILVVVRLLRHWREVDALLRTARLSRARFSRVFLLSAVFVVVYTPLAVYIYVRSLGGSLDGWSWAEVHPPGWDRLILKTPSGGTVWFDRWVQVVSGYVVFVVFGLGTDARATYRRWAQTIGMGKIRSWFQTATTKRVLRRSNPSGQYSGSDRRMPRQESLVVLAFP